MPDGAPQGLPDSIACALMELMLASISWDEFQGASAQETAHVLQQDLNVILSGYPLELRTAVAAQLCALMARDDLTIFGIVGRN